MADLRNGEVAVDVAANESTMGPSGNRRRKPTSAYLLVGGSSDVYSVTISTAGGHFCVKQGTGKPCQGNLHGKGQKYGSVHTRDRTDPQQWCKHVQAALAAPDLVAEAQEITAQAFGERTAVVRVADPVPAFPEADESDPRARLAALDAEREELRERIAEADAEELRAAIAPLVERFGLDAVKAAALEAVA